jgi:hypothetical protein
MKAFGYQLSMIRPIFLTVLFACAVFSGSAAAQATVDPGAYPSRFRIGEKLTYNVSFGKFSNAAYFETAVISRGKLSGQDVVELRSTLRTLGVVSAAFFQVDETRTVFAAPDTGLPLYISKVVNYGVEPKESVDNFLKEPTASFDLLTLIYKARDAKGSGTFPLVENGQHYTVTFQGAESEHIKTEAGEFDTIVSIVQSEYLTANGIKELKINFVDDEFRVPALIRLKTAKGITEASVASIQIPKPVAAQTPALVVQQTPPPVALAPPKLTPTPYIENQPVSPELGFALGEVLDYAVSESGKPVAVISLSARERKMFQSEDSLLLTATVKSVQPGRWPLAAGDSINVQVDPETLAPRWMEMRFAGELKALNRTVTFDMKSGNISFGKTNPVNSPIGTHTILSMIYAMRSFNLKPSRDPKNPVNDTRVAVFWDTKPYIFVLQPSNPDEITVGGEKVSAQMITVVTSNPELDKLAPKIWLSTDGRVPVRVAFGSYQADLISPAKKQLQ